MSVFNSVTAESPCPICGKPDWCARLPEGVVKCNRQTEPPAGWFRISTKDRGGVFRPDRDSRDGPPPLNAAAPLRTGRATKATPGKAAPLYDADARDWAAKFAPLAEAMTDKHWADLAGTFGLPESAVRRLRVGWASREALDALNAWPSKERPPGAWAFEEVDGWGRSVGISLRADDGRKRFAPGGHRGLAVPRDFDTADTLVLLVEGASDVAASPAGLRAVGRPSCTGGVDHLADLLAGDDVLVVGERDTKPNGDWPGRDGARATAQKLAERWDRPVRWAMVPEEAKDLRAWAVAAGEDWKREAVLARLAESESVATPPQRSNNYKTPPDTPGAGGFVARARPFPVHALPATVAALVAEGASAQGCDPVSIGGPALAALSGAVGNARRVQVRSDFTQPAVLWVVVLAESGSGKTPAFNLAMDPLRKLERRLYTEHVERMREYKAEDAKHDAAVKAYRKNPDGEPPEEPSEPLAERVLVDNTTTEAVVMLLGSNPRGLLAARAELAAWFKAFDAYRSGKGGDLQTWLEFHDAGQASTDRKTNAEHVLIPRAAVALTGTIQPEVFRRAAGVEENESGLTARLLVAMPAPRPVRWSDAEVSPRTLEKYSATLHALRGLDFDPDPEADPPALNLTPDARAAWIVFHDAFAAEGEALPTGPLRTAYPKLRGYALRLALVLHLARVAEHDPDADPAAVDLQSFNNAVELVRYFTTEAHRVYGRMGETEADAAVRELADRVRLAGGSMNGRELVQASKANWPKVADAEAALHTLAEAGQGAWVFPPQNGKPGRAPARRLVLHIDSQSNKTPPDAPATGGSVAVAVLPDAVTPYESKDAPGPGEAVEL